MSSNPLVSSFDRLEVSGPSPSPLPQTGEGKTFDAFRLTPSVLAAVKAMGITTPTPIQSQAIPVLLGGGDVIGQAQTGSGKTLAFALPLVERCDPQTRAVQALILTPTRELAIQVGDVVRKIAVTRRLNMILLYGGRSLGADRQALRSGPQIIVGTPGRTLDHLKQGTLTLRNVRFLVLDEGDQMLDQGFAPDVERILSYTPTTRQTALFSATVPDWVRTIAEKHLRAPVTIKVVGQEAPPDIHHSVYHMDNSVRMQALQRLLDDRGTGSVLVFGRTKHGVRKLAKVLGELRYPVGALQGNLSQNARERVMADFRSGKLPILVATNVAARGIDVTDIGLVINYELPESAELFTHRVGRTARMGRRGDAITFIVPDDEGKWRGMERELGHRLPAFTWRDGRPVPYERPQFQPRPQFQSRPQSRPSPRRYDSRPQRPASPRYDTRPQRPPPSPRYDERPQRPQRYEPRPATSEQAGARHDAKPQRPAFPRFPQRGDAPRYESRLMPQRDSREAARPQVTASQPQSSEPRHDAKPVSQFKTPSFRRPSSGYRGGNGQRREGGGQGGYGRRGR